ncbi:MULTISPECIES: MFS transporter [unclassified Paenibacillus]|uniref:MFS transporter n=1 Tax=unclassified Paenibacillus TaxID=185978 RepID=UPI001AE855C6|nr:MULTISPECIES: MFS transporter [unclassified Paenibacillus]MBP1154985.1 MFS family permease [Paenibacillus sp. PvP091]MBP1169631.1 MFS family permease [Paenibacillus sp. PvR098]MBP2440659.1 MFS family permease [Paenibacillus sp. PvP052]
MLIRNILLIIVLYQVMVFATRPLVSLYAVSMGASTAEIGFLVAVYSFFPFLFAIPIGKLSDRIGDKIPTIIGTLGLVLGMAAPVLYPSMLTLYVSQAFIGVSQIFINVNLQNLIGVISKREDRDQNYSYFTLAVGVGGVLGPIAGGYMAEHISYLFAYLAAACIGIVPVLLAFMLPTIKRKPRPEPATSDAKGSLQLLRIPELQTALLVSALVLYSRDLYMAYFPLYASSLDYTVSQIGGVLTVQGVALVAVRWFLPSLILRLGRERVLYLTLFFAGLSFLLTPIFTQLYMFYLLAVLMGIGLGCGQPLSMTTTYNAAPESRTAEALGLRLAISRLAQVVAPLLFGVIGTLSGLSPVFYISGFLLFGGSYVAAKRKREEGPLQESKS